MPLIIILLHIMLYVSLPNQPSAITQIESRIIITVHRVLDQTEQAKQIFLRLTLQLNAQRMQLQHMQ